MKKTVLLTLFSLLVSTIGVWGATCVYDTYSSEFQLTRSSTKAIEIDPGYEYTVTFTGKISSKATYDFEIQSYNPNHSILSDGWEKLASQNLTTSSVDYTLSFTYDSKYTKLRLKNCATTGTKTMTISNLVFTKNTSIDIKQNSSDLGSILVGYTKTVSSVITINYTAPKSDIVIKAESDNGTVSLSPTGIDGCTKGSASLNLTYTPTTIGFVNVKVTLSGGATGTYNFTGSSTLDAPELSCPESSIGYKSATLEWNKVDGATGYSIYNNGVLFKGNIDKNQTSITFNDLSLHTTYNFTITSMYGEIGSEPSNSVEVKTKDLAPTTLTVTPSYSHADISWTKVNDATKYILTSDKGLSKEFSASDELKYTDAGLISGASYTYTVTAYLDNEATAQPTSQTVTILGGGCANPNFTTIDDKTYTIECGTSYKFTDAIKLFNFESTEITISYNVERTSSYLDPGFRVQASVDGSSNWQYITDEESTSEGTLKASIKQSDGYKYIRIGALHILGAKVEISNISQAPYFAVPETFDMGNVVNNVSVTKNIEIPFSANAAEVSLIDGDDSQYFTVTSQNIGATTDVCAYGTATIPVTINSTKAGENIAYIKVGNKQIKVTATVTLPVPIATATPDYHFVTLNWNKIDGADGYKITGTDGTDKEVDANTTSLVCDKLNLDTDYTYYVKAIKGDVYTDACEVKTTTKDLKASTSFIVSNESYTSVDATWNAIEDATGYYIVSTDGTFEVKFDGATTSAKLIGLNTNKTYAFNVYGIYHYGEEDEEISNNYTTSNEITTLTSLCEEQTFDNITLSNENWSSPVQVDRYKANVSFQYSVTATLDITYTAQESADGNSWEQCWSKTGRSGNAEFTLKENSKFIRFKRSNGASICLTTPTISNITALQAIYLSPQVTELDLGNVVKGETATGIVNVDFSAMAGDVTVKDNDPSFTVSPNKVGAYGEDGCAYGTEAVTVTFNASKFGLNEATVTIGDYNVAVKAMVTLPVPEPTIENVSYTSVVLGWDKIDGADGYTIAYGDSVKTISQSDFTGTYTVPDLELGTEYTFTVKAFSGEVFTDPASVTATTLDLPVTTSFILSDISYTSMTATWNVVENATGYAIKNETTGIITYIEEVSKTSTVLVGLLPGTEYTFTIFATYDSHLATQGISATAATEVSKCAPEIFEDVRLGEDCGILEPCAWDWNVKEKIIETTLNDPTLNFSYSVATGSTKKESIYAPDVAIYEFNETTKEWDLHTNIERARTGTQTIKATTRTVRKFKITFDGNFYCDLKGISVMQGMYFEPKDTKVEFGTCTIGSTPTSNFRADFSAMSANVVNAEGSPFTPSKSIMGATEENYCASGEDINVISANTVLEPGEYTSTMTVGSNIINLSMTVAPLPAPVDFYANPGSITTSLNWKMVENATGYRIRYKVSESTDTPQTVDVPSTETSVTLYDLIPNTLYDFTITALYNNIENTTTSTKATTLPLPGPSNFKVSEELTHSAKFTWDTVDGATGYMLAWTKEGTDDQGNIVIDNPLATEQVLDNLKYSGDYTVTIYSMYGTALQGATVLTANLHCQVTVKYDGEYIDCQTHTIDFVSGTKYDDNTYKSGAKINFKSSLKQDCIGEPIFDYITVECDGKTTTYTSAELTSFEILGETTITTFYADNSGVVEINGKKYETIAEAVQDASEGELVLLKDAEDQDLIVNVSDKVQFNGNGYKIKNIHIEENGDLELTGNLTAVNFGLAAGIGASGQYEENGGKLTIIGRAYIDKTMDPSGMTNENKWYGISFPFPVSSLEVFALVNGNEKTLTYYTDYVFASFDGIKRASSGKGFTMMTIGGATLEIGKFYMFATTTKINTFRFYKKEGSSLVNPSNILDLYEYPSSSAKNAGWNNIGNSQLYHVGVESESSFAQVYINGENKYLTVDLSETTLGVTSPMFIQQGEGMSPIATLSRKNEGTLRSAEIKQQNTYKVQIFKQGESMASDQLFIRTVNDRANQYTIGHDLMKFEVSSAHSQIYTKAFDMNLSVYEAALNNHTTDVPLYLFAPSNGNYKLSIGNDIPEGAVIYLTKDGTPIHNFSDNNEFALALSKGTNTSYAIRIYEENVPVITTDEAVNDNLNIYVENGNILVISNMKAGQQYSVGDMLRTLITNVSNGETIRMHIAEKGIYWVNIENTSVKVEITK
ncbi:MAG: fibronectin type III domain-containing protein [Paludibacteraceae bacterium]|nr:fibronectin type III domain-containing protein [Paludibacteraceae bacterium]